MRKSILTLSAVAFAGALLAASVPAGAFTLWGPSTPTSITNYTDNSSVVVGDFAQVRVGVFGGGVTAFINSNKGPFVNTASITCNTGSNGSSLNGTSTTDANITLVCPWFGNTLQANGTIESE
jgi:hypothetical protein